MQTNIIHCGNHLDILKEYPDGFFDMFLTSPPYDNLRDYEGYTFEFEPLAHELYRVLKDGGVGVWVVNDATVNGSETLTSFKQAIYFKDVVGFNVHDTMIYYSSKMVLNHNRYEQEFEYMIVLSKGKVSTFNPIKVPCKNIGASNKTKTFRHEGKGISKIHNATFVKDSKIKGNVWFMQTGFGHSSKERIAFQHPAIFPEKLAEDHILSWSNPGDVILDPMAGSFTTCKMAVKHGRQYVGVDISEKYCEIGRKRIEKFTAQKDMFVNLEYNK